MGPRVPTSHPSGTQCPLGCRAPSLRLLSSRLSGRPRERTNLSPRLFMLRDPGLSVPQPLTAGVLGTQGPTARPPPSPRVCDSGPRQPCLWLLCRRRWMRSHLVGDSSSCFPHGSSRPGESVEEGEEEEESPTERAPWALKSQAQVCSVLHLDPLCTQAALNMCLSPEGR